MVKMKDMVRTSLIAAITAGAVSATASAQSVGSVIDAAEQSTTAGQQTQARIDRLDDQRTDAELEYRALLQQIESQQLFIEQQQIFIRSQENEFESLNQQLARVDNIETELAPMLREMVVSLENFINLDLPFRLEGENGRQARIERLYTIVDDPNISPAERYRAILNAYEIEASYGRFIRSYDETVLDEAGNPVPVVILQLGRIAAIRKYNDDTMTIRYNGSDDWQPLASSYLSDVTRAIRIAQEVTTPSVYTIPLPGPQVAQ